MNDKRRAIASMLIKWAIRGAKLSKGKHGKMCTTCAFRKNTEANNDKIVFDATDCIAGSPHPFYCHENDNQKCIGYLNALEL